MKSLGHAVIVFIGLYNFFSISVVYGQIVNAQNMADLQNQLAVTGNASVIVEYSNDIGGALSMHSLGEEGLRNTINSQQQRFELSLSSQVKNAIDHSYTYVPAAVMTVNASMLKELEANPMVKAIYPNKMLKPTLADSVDVVFRRHKSSEYDGTEWAVVVIDTGVDKNHSFLKTGSSQKVVSEACYSGGGYNPSIYREVDRLCPGNFEVTTASGSGVHCTRYSGCDHGTHVAGIATGDGTNFSGVAMAGNIIAIQVFTGLNDVLGFNPCGGPYSCITAFSSDIIKGLERVYALRNTYKIAAVNMSLGYGRFSSTCAGENQAMTSIINLLKQAGIATVVSSGNDGFTSSMGFPACIPNAIAVGATENSSGFFDERASYSNVSSQLDLYAPGSNILSSLPGNRFEYFSGTSMAAPHVAGAFAVIRQALPDASVDQILSVLKAVGPNVIEAGISRRRLDVRSALSELGFSEADVSSILQLLLFEDD